MGHMDSAPLLEPCKHLAHLLYFMSPERTSGKWNNQYCRNQIDNRSQSTIMPSEYNLNQKAAAIYNSVYPPNAIAIALNRSFPNAANLKMATPMEINIVPIHITTTRFQASFLKYSVITLSSSNSRQVRTVLSSSQSVKPTFSDP